MTDKSSTQNKSFSATSAFKQQSCQTEFNIPQTESDLRIQGKYKLRNVLKKDRFSSHAKM